MLFISTFRGKLGFIGVVSPIILFFKGLGQGLSVGEVFANAGIIMLIVLLIGISFLLPDILYVVNGPVKTWSRWGDSRSYLKKKDYENVKFVRVFPKTLYALGEDNRHHRVATTLLRWSCRDFKTKRRPCAHMHKLAEKLGVHDVE